MFEAGVAELSDKLSPAAMLERLRQKYPEKYSLPLESDIQSYVSLLFGRKKRGLSLQATGQHGRRGISESFAKSISDMIDDEPHLKPSTGLSRLRSMYSGDDGAPPDDFPTEKQIKSKICSTKAARKKTSGSL